MYINQNVTELNFFENIYNHNVYYIMLKVNITNVNTKCIHLI